MLKPRLISLLSALCLAASTASIAHADTCHTQSDAEAALRYQAKLRVIALSCTSSVPGGSLYTQYQSFTARSQDVLDQYQTRLLAYYKAHGKGDPAAKLRSRDTELNNEEALNAARGGLAFCRAHVGDLQHAATQSPAETRTAIESMGGKCS